MGGGGWRKFGINLIIFLAKYQKYLVKEMCLINQPCYVIKMRGIKREELGKKTPKKVMDNLSFS